MPRTASFRTLALALVLTGPVAVSAAQPAPPPGEPSPVFRLTLAEALARGVEASHRLGELGAREDAARATADSAKASRLPQLALQAGYTRTNHVDEYGLPQPDGRLRVIYPDVPDNLRTRLDLQWLAYSGGRVEALARAALAEADASRADRAAQRVDVRLDVARAYWGLVTARDAVRGVEQALERVRASLRDARARLASGFVPPSDVLSAEAQESLQRALLVEAQNAERVAALQLARVLGLPPAARVEPTEPLDAAPAAPADVAALVAEAKGAREDRRALEARLTALGARRDAAAAGSRPSVVVSSGVDYARPNPRIFPRAAAWHDSWDVGIAATWSLFDGGRVRAEVSAAEATQRALAERLADLDTAIDLEVRQRALEVDSWRARAAAAARAVRSAAEARRVLQDRHDAGVATSTEVLDAQVLLLQAELDRVRALASARVAQAALDRALGR